MFLLRLDHVPFRSELPTKRGWRMSDYRLTGKVLLDEFREIHGDVVADRLEQEYNTRAGSPTAWQDLQALDGPDLTRAERDKQRTDCYNEAVHDLVGRPDSPSGQTALCLSGGGIRSAAFALGILQGLARKGLLSQFHYLSTVSGGGYIGGWLMAWAARPNEAAGNLRPSFDEIQAALAADTAASPVRELRKGQSFLTPRTGIGSPDTWMALAHVIRNMVLNWVVFIPFLLAILLLPLALCHALQAWTDSMPTGMSSSLVELSKFVLPWGSAAAFQNNLHFWLDSVAAGLVAIGLCTAMVTRSAGCSMALGDALFVAFVLAPVTVGAVLLVASSSVWLQPSGLHGEMVAQWTALCALTFVVVRILAMVAAGILSLTLDGFRSDPDARWSHLHWELLAQGVAGGLVGLSISTGLWLFAAPKGGLEPSAAVIRAIPWFLCSFLLGQTLLSALTSHLYREAGDRNREWLARASGWYGAVAALWFAFSWITLSSWEAIQGHLPTLTLATAGSGLLSIVGGASPLTKAVSKSGMGEHVRLSNIVTALAVLTILGLLILLARGARLLLTVTEEHWAGLVHAIHWVSWGLWPEPAPAPTASEPVVWTALGHLGAIGALVAALVLLSAGASFFVNVNYFSLGGMYRNRLVRAFLGASNILPITGKATERNPFDGLADADNLAMADQNHGRRDRGVPFHIVNMALDLTATKNTAWQERKAASFVSTPLVTGGHEVGYRASRDYARGSQRNRGLSLGSAMAISGAAVSPNWGYHSSPTTSFLMALFNVRLGSWLGNPKNDKTYLYDGPRFGWQRLWQEALGQVSDESRYLYLSDGGHFENLGLYEMVRRRCHTIVVSDAGMDEGCRLEDLGNAVRKIAIDLDVRIEFDRILVEKRTKAIANPGVYCAVGSVFYPERPGSPGTIVYVKPGLYQDAPAHVRAYAAANAAFPHDNTLNQWFTESQFESYRALGEHAIQMIVVQRDNNGNKTGEHNPQDLSDFATLARDYVSGFSNWSLKTTPVRLVS